MLPVKEYIKHPNVLGILLLKRYGKWLSDEAYIKLMFRLYMGHKLNLKSPTTFSEKIQWLKLYNRRPEYTMMVDKYAVKDYVAKTIGEEYIIPTIGVWDRPEDIEWDSLPDQFVLKTTHGGGNTGVVICKDKSTFDIQNAVEKLKKSLKEDLYIALREWPYKDVPKRIIAEKYISPAPNVVDIPDYKWYCFNGEPKFCQVILDRNSNETIDFFDTDWQHQEFSGMNPMAGPGWSHAAVLPERPANLETQILIARELSKDLPYSRIDLYETGEGIYFGEITFYPGSGLGRFRPDEYNELLGEMVNLPGQNGGGLIIKKLQNNKLYITKVDLSDYKFFCFDGEVKALFVGTERQSGDVKFDYYDADFNHLDIVQSHPMSGKVIVKPDNFDQMKQLASKLSIGIPHVRVDMYNVSGKIYFGELTFFHHGGITPFHPEEWDNTFGSWIKLPGKYNKK